MAHEERTGGDGGAGRDGDGTRGRGREGRDRDGVGPASADLAGAGCAEALSLAERRFSVPGLSAVQSQRMRSHLAACPECRQAYATLLAGRRAAAGLSPSMPSALESRLLMEETLARHEERSRLSPVVRTRVLAHLFSWPRATRGLAAAALVAVLSLAFWRLTSTGSGEGPGDGGRGTDPGTTILSRGQDDALPPVAVGISGVDDEGREYEAVDGDGVCLEHALKFYLALREPAFDHYAILGLQDGVPLWYIPEPGENRDYVVPRDVELPYMLPWEVALAPRHHAGQALVVAVLSRSRVNPSDVEAALPKAASAGTSSGEVEALLARALGPRYRVSAVAYTVRSCEVER